MSEAEWCNWCAERPATEVGESIAGEPICLRCAEDAHAYWHRDEGCEWGTDEHGAPCEHCEWLAPLLTEDRQAGGTA